VTALYVYFTWKLVQQGKRNVDTALELHERERMHREESALLAVRAELGEIATVCLPVSTPDGKRLDPIPLPTGCWDDLKADLTINGAELMGALYALYRQARRCNAMCDGWVRSHGSIQADWYNQWQQCARILEPLAIEAMRKIDVLMETERGARGDPDRKRPRELKFAARWSAPLRSRLG